MKSLAGRLANLWGEFQVIMGADGANVTEVSGQMRQPGLHVHPLGVPMLEHQNGGGMAKIMNARRMPVSIKDTGAHAYLTP